MASDNKTCILNVCYTANGGCAQTCTPDGWNLIFLSPRLSNSIFSRYLFMQFRLYARCKRKNMHAEARSAIQRLEITVLNCAAVDGHHCVNTDPVIGCSGLGATALVLQGVLTDTISLYVKLVGIIKEMENLFFIFSPGIYQIIFLPELRRMHFLACPR